MTTPAERASQADYDAGLAWRDGDLDQAAALILKAMQLDPARSGLWEARQQRISVAARQAAERGEGGRCQLAGHARLAAEVARRLDAAGIGVGEPTLRAWARWNLAARERSGIHQPERAPEPEPELDLQTELEAGA